MKNTETQLVKACLQWLHLEGYFAYRSNSGAMQVRKPDGQFRFVRFGTPGLADITGMLRSGRALYVECKLPGNRQTMAQKNFQYEVGMSGGLYVLTYSLDDLAEAVQAAQ